MVRLHRVVAEGHVSHEVAEVSCLHQPLPSCRRRKSPSHEHTHVGTHHGWDGDVKSGSEARGRSLTDSKPHSVPLPPYLWLQTLYCNFFSHNKALFHVPPNGFFIRNFLNIFVLPEGKKQVDMPTPELEQFHWKGQFLNQASWGH